MAAGPGVEFTGAEREADLQEDRVVERDEIGVVPEVFDGLDIARAERRVEDEAIVAAAAAEHIVARAAVKRTVAGLASSKRRVGCNEATRRDVVKQPSSCKGANHAD